jgi:hypothetical protein
MTNEIKEALIYAPIMKNYIEHKPEGFERVLSEFSLMGGTHT